jgi:hypothetical protein
MLIVKKFIDTGSADGMTDPHVLSVILTSVVSGRIDT